jgi:signal transduction histidine kinase
LQKLETPNTNLREAVNSAAGPAAFSNSVLLQFAPISFLLVFVSSPDRIGGSPLQWLLLALVGYLVTVAILLAFRFTVLSADENRKPRILVTSLAYVVAGAGRGLSIYSSGDALGIMAPEEFWYRLVGGPLFVYGSISVLAILQGSRNRHQKILDALELEKSQLDELRGGIRERIKSQRKDLLARVQFQLAPVFQEMNAGTNSASTKISQRLTEFVDAVVRPLSHNIGQESSFEVRASDLTKKASRAKVKPQYLFKISVGMTIIPELMTFAAASLIIASTTMIFPDAFAFATVLSLVAVYISSSILKRALKRLTLLTPLAFIVSLLSGIATSIFSYLTLLVFGLVLSGAQLLQFAAAQVLVAGISFAIQLQRTQRLNAEQEMTGVVKNLEILNSQLRQELWLNRRKIASVLHGSVQSTLYASAMRLAKIESPSADELQAVRDDLNAAISKLDSLESGESIDEILKQIIEVWDGVVEIKLPEIPTDLSKALAENQAASACLAEVIREAVSNAVKHGAAKQIEVKVEKAARNLISVMVSNDGKPLSKQTDTGYGSSILDEVALNWSLESTGELTLLRAQIAV